MWSGPSLNRWPGFVENYVLETTLLEGRHAALAQSTVIEAFLLRAICSEPPPVTATRPITCLATRRKPAAHSADSIIKTSNLMSVVSMIGANKQRARLNCELDSNKGIISL